MEITSAQALFIGLWAAIAVTGTLLGNYTATPLVYATGVGIILGDIQTGIIVGAAGQTVWLGFGVSQGGVRPPDPIAPGIFATVIAIASRQSSGGVALAPMTITDAGVFIGYSVPIGIMMQLLITFLFTLMSPISQLAKKAIENEKYWLFKLYSNMSMIVLVLFTFGFGIAVGFSANGLSTLANEIPDWLRIGFRVAGGLLPALGFALILKVMIKKEYIGFVFIGYFLTLVFEIIATVTKTSFSVLGLAITAFGFVMIIVSIAKLAGFDEKLKTPIMPINMQNNQNNNGGQDEGI
ncbi:PTS sugar transporter subunit IIC [Mycoplasma crocodyli]|uniref:PTS system, N-acetylgalactosamine-specific, IIC component n=1 Tax=Mycoplasma crocodyli (strain ATCC 51981 / MP145) TaxID=512564 RepID=D5E5I7_MYCCM|nr:PTS sugar transporter subunit IIC [Mycoplasma crocodyli]ADE19370.1 PTS system, N-acetylgalactosamine-specific, IIC component [Mycoplasma crocodyli MP145]